MVEDFATARPGSRQPPSALRGGARALPARPQRPAGGRAHLALLELSAIERPIRAAGSTDILDYRDKYVAGEGMAGATESSRPRFPPSWKRDCAKPASGSRRCPGCAGVARIDYLSDGDQFVVNEINTVPGSLARYLWVDPVPFGTLLTDLLAEARQRPTHAYSAAGADGTVLRSAGSIAGKLG